MDKQPNGNGTKWTEPTVTANEAHARPLYTGTFQRPLLAGEADVLAVPWRVRLRWGWDTMVRETAKLAGVRPESRLRLVPILVGLGGFVLSVAAIILSVGVFQGRTTANEDVAKENRAAVERQIAASEARATKSREESQAALLGAANEIKESMQGMRAELMGEVSAIRGTVATTQTQMARAEARLDSLHEENRQLRDDLRLEKLQRETLERRIRAAGVKIE